MNLEIRSAHDFDSNQNESIITSQLNNLSLTDTPTGASANEMPIEIWMSHISPHCIEKAYRNLRGSCKMFRSLPFTTQVPQHQEWINQMACRAIKNIVEHKRKVVDKNSNELLKTAGWLGVVLPTHCLFGSSRITEKVVFELSCGGIDAFNDLTEEFKQSVNAFHYHGTDLRVFRGMRLFPNIETLTLVGSSRTIGADDINLHSLSYLQKLKKLVIESNSLTGSTFYSLPPSIEELSFSNRCLMSTDLENLSHLHNLKKLDIRKTSIKAIPDCLKSMNIEIQYNTKIRKPA